MVDDRHAVLEEYIRTKLVARPHPSLTADTPLHPNGLVDSMGMVLLAAFVEKQFGVPVSDGDLRAGSLSTIARILTFVDRRR
jgi:acyl carrier protein